LWQAGLLGIGSLFGYSFVDIPLELFIFAYRIIHLYGQISMVEFNLKQFFPTFSPYYQILHLPISVILLAEFRLRNINLLAGFDLD